MILQRSSTDESAVEAKAKAASYCLAMTLDRDPRRENVGGGGDDEGLLARLPFKAVSDIVCCSQQELRQIETQ
jgi:hypothetical protein